MKYNRQNRTENPLERGEEGETRLFLGPNLARRDNPLPTPYQCWRKHQSLGVRVGSGLYFQFNSGGPYPWHIVVRRRDPVRIKYSP